MARDEDRLKMSRGYVPPPTAPPAPSIQPPNATRTRTFWNPDTATTDRIKQERLAAIAARDVSGNILAGQAQSRQRNVEESLNPLPPAPEGMGSKRANFQSRYVPPIAAAAVPLPAIATQVSGGQPETLRPSPSAALLALMRQPIAKVPEAQAITEPIIARGVGAGTSSPEFQRLYAKHGPQAVGGQTEAPVSRVLEGAPGLGGGTFQTKYNPTTGKMERTQLSGTAFDFGRNQRDRLNSLYGRNLDQGFSPAEAAENARLEELATSSLGGRVEAGILEGIRNRRAASQLATGKAETERMTAEANIGKTQAEMDQLGQMNAIMRKDPKRGEDIARQRLGISTKAPTAPPGMDAIRKSVFGNITVTPGLVEGAGDTVTVDALGLTVPGELYAKMEQLAQDYMNAGVAPNAISARELYAQVLGRAPAPQE